MLEFPINKAVSPHEWQKTIHALYDIPLEQIAVVSDIAEIDDDQRDGLIAIVEVKKLERGDFPYYVTLRLWHESFTDIMAYNPSRWANEVCAIVKKVGGSALVKAPSANSAAYVLIKSSGCGQQVLVASQLLEQFGGFSIQETVVSA